MQEESQESQSLLKQKEWKKLTNSASFSPIFSLLLSAAFSLVSISISLYCYNTTFIIIFKSNNTQNSRISITYFVMEKTNCSSLFDCLLILVYVGLFMISRYYLLNIPNTTSSCLQIFLYPKNILA